MSLYIKLFNDFWNHRKTARLRSRLGDDAFWIMPRLWSYAAESQPDGDFSDYTDDELAMLIGCLKHATSIKEKLVESGFMDSDHVLHNWKSRNGYHAAYSERAKTAALARWGEDSSISENDTTRQETSNASSIEFASFWSAYPRKTGKKAALKAWLAAKDKPSIEAILASIALQKKCDQWVKDGGKFIPHPATWLNQGRWGDMPIEAPKQYRGPNI